MLICDRCEKKPATRAQFQAVAPAPAPGQPPSRVQVGADLCADCIKELRDVIAKYIETPPEK